MTEKRSFLLLLCGLTLFGTACQQAPPPGKTRGQVFEFVRSNNVTALDRLLTQYPKATEAVEPNYRATPLHVAAQQSSLAVVNLLIDKGADVNARDKVGRTPLHYALLAGRRDVAKRLLERGADWRITTPEGMTCLHFAAMSNQPDLVRLCFQKGLSVDAVSSLGTPLHVAALANAERAAEELLRLGANVNACTDAGRETPLHVAAAAGAWKVARVLTKHGADVHARSALGWTPLHSACNSASGTRVVEVLLAGGADPNATDNTGRTPLFYLAIKAGREKDGIPVHARAYQREWQQLSNQARMNALKMARLLIAAGAKVDVKDASGYTAEQVAARAGFQEMVTLLRNR